MLDEIEFIWAPEDTPRCVDTETVPATRDVRQKPYILVYETDRKLGFKTDAVAGYRTEKSLHCGGRTRHAEQLATAEDCLAVVPKDRSRRDWSEYGDSTENIAARHEGEQANHRLKLSPTELERPPGLCANEKVTDSRQYQS